ncbi:hypothetical protein NC653_018090 [Populus alba x Populus x berolinensis]|uniref:Uncharacterized protein n=1 Tax=Populus alba x Populus x berolinensis TaxID=444605 RepID=A0AAD6W1B6_9ROSI|nr:hypothetical protein NC653_018090 [Populus alba x Populus x berolinensis]
MRLVTGTSLQDFDVKNNSLTGKQLPENIGKLYILSGLGLVPINQLTGEIPFNMYLHGKPKLTGSIPPELGNNDKASLPCFFVFPRELNDNQLTGNIPPELGKLTDLYDLNVANNHLEGPIPDNLSSCTNLNSLNVHGNNLNGTIPRALRRLESMTNLNLSSNNIQGPIPIELSRISNLDTLDISNNKISGSIPSSLGYWSIF